MTSQPRGQQGPIDLIVVEDSFVDAELEVDALREAGLTVEVRRVEDEPAFRAALDERLPDAILSDWTLPLFSGRRALEIAHERCPVVPFIFVSGTISESAAIEALRQGAIDYVYKHQLQLLGPALLRAVNEARMLCSLRESEERYRFLFNGILDAVYVHEVSVEKLGKFIAVNGSACSMLGYTMDEFLQMELKDIDIPEQTAKTSSIHEKLFRDGCALFETCHVAKDGRRIPVEINIRLFELQGKSMALSVARDITERTRLEAEREKLLQDLGERVKELRCINDISRRAEEHRTSIEEFLQQAVGILPTAWRYPEICAARITLNSKEFKTANFRETEWSQVADIIVDRKKVGEVTLCYLEEKPAADEGPFLKEERSLINTVAEFLGHIIQHRLSEAEIRASEEKFRMIFDNANDGILLADTESKKFHFANVMICRMLGYSLEELRNMGVMDIHPEKDIPYVIEQFEKQSRKEIELAENLPVKRKDGSVFYADVNSSLVEISGKSYLMRIFRDITERKQAEEMMQKLHHHNELILNSASEGIIGVDSQGNHTFVNPSAAGMLGYEAEELIGKHSHTIWHHSMDNGSPCPEDGCPIYATLKDGSVHHNVRDEVFWRKDGTSFPVAYSSNPIIDEGRIIGAVVNFRDITKRKQMEEKLQYLAYYDSLTDLPNRNLFLERIDREIAEAKNSSHSIAVLLTDINKFKSINDTYGSEVGDRVLKEVAKRLSTAVRQGDTVAHLGNDEFGIACIGLAGADDIIMLEKIIRNISYPLKIAGDEITLTFSTGISLYPHDGENAFELLKSAGLALSIAEKQGSKIFQFYTKDMTVTAAEVILLEKQLIKAIKNEEFILHYQPYWDITTKKMVGMEALIRWQSKDKGLVPPGKFIPMLEDTGMIIEVGEWILREAMRQVKEWQDKRYPVVPVSVNMSLVQFRQKNLAEMVKRIMGECGFYPSLLTLEITESAFMQDIEFTRSVLTAMKEIGCSVSIDDFGTGYSSLAYLKRLPVDNLKIDISFIREMVKDPDSASIVVAIINMAHSLNLKTIAEGIETEEQWKFLHLCRCDMGQGFYLSKPLPADKFEKLLNTLTTDI